MPRFWAATVSQMALNRLRTYAGHQFGHFVPQLGDGRANLLGKLSGQTEIVTTFSSKVRPHALLPWRRWQSSPGPALREYIVSEAMAALGVPTTRALAVVMTGEQVLRETVLPGAVLTRDRPQPPSRWHLRVFRSSSETQKRSGCWRTMR